MSGEGDDNVGRPKRVLTPSELQSRLSEIGGALARRGGTARKSLPPTHNCTGCPNDEAPMSAVRSVGGGGVAPKRSANVGVESSAKSVRVVTAETEESGAAPAADVTVSTDADDGMQEAATAAHSPAADSPAAAHTQDDVGSGLIGGVLPVPLCLCRLVEGVRDDETPPLLCAAVSNITGKKVACSNPLEQSERGALLLRAHVRIPFAAFCDAHINLLRMHYCCPACGVFCLQGTFNECRSGRPPHYFHTHCSSPLDACPHCGGDDIRQQHINVYSRPPPSEEDSALYEIHRQVAAKMSIERQPKALQMMIGDEKDCLQAGTSQIWTTPLLAKEEYKEKLNDVKRILDSGFILPPFDNISEAIENKDLYSVVYLLKGMKFDTNEPLDATKNTPLHAAILAKDFLICYVLLQAQADPNLQNMDRMTPLALACHLGLPEIVELLLRFDADPSISVTYEDTDRSTALHVAAVNGCVEMVGSVLRSRRVPPNVTDDGGWTPLAWAVEHGRVDAALLLLDHGAKPMIRDLEGNVTMHWAAFNGSLSIAERLVEINGVSTLKAANNFRDTPLHVACRRNSWHLVRFLVGKTADVWAENSEGETPLSICQARGVDVPPDVRLLIEDIAADRSRRRRTADRILLTDLAGGREFLPVPVVNGVDEQTTPTDFQYVASLVETIDRLGIDRRINHFRHCDCTDDCSSGNCSCNELNHDTGTGCVYEPDRTLTAYFDRAATDTIYECNPACRCHAARCRNRVAQRGITTHFQLFKTIDRGWAVRTLEKIRRGTFICEYGGEVLTSEEADRREDDSYLFEMESEGLSHCIDAKTYGNLTRFINHGCAPNLTPLKVFWDHQDSRFPHICLFAARDISENEELTFDYGEKFWIVKYRQFRCACQAATCKYGEANIANFIADYHRRTGGVGESPD